MKQPLVLLPLLLPVAAVAQTPARLDVPIRMSWTSLDRSGTQPVVQLGSLVVSFGCGPVEATWGRNPEGDREKRDTKWTQVETEGCGDENGLAEFVRVDNYSKEIGVNYETTDELCRDWRERKDGDTCALVHNNWDGHPSSYVIVRDTSRIAIGWFIVLDKHVAISLTFFAPTGKYSPDDWNAFSHSLVIKPLLTLK